MIAPTMIALAMNAPLMIVPTMTAPFTITPTMVTLLLAARRTTTRCVAVHDHAPCTVPFMVERALRVIKDYAPADPFPGCGDLTIKAGQRAAIEKRGNDHMHRTSDGCDCRRV